jgi:hypothetical protein
VLNAPGGNAAFQGSRASGDQGRRVIRQAPSAKLALNRTQRLCVRQESLLRAPSLVTEQMLGPWRESAALRCHKSVQATLAGGFGTETCSTSAEKAQTSIHHTETHHSQQYCVTLPMPAQLRLAVGRSDAAARSALTSREPALTLPLLTLFSHCHTSAGRTRPSSTALQVQNSAG